MKKLLFFAVFAAISFAGCSKDDGPAEGLPEGTEITLAGYEEPLMLWGASPETVKSKVKYSLIASDSELLTFAGKDKVRGYSYNFKENKLSISVAMVNADYASELGGFMSEKYVPVSIDEETYSLGYTNKERNMVILVRVMSVTTIFVGYSPVGASGASLAPVADSAAPDAGMAEVFRQLKGTN